MGHGFGSIIGDQCGDQRILHQKVRGLSWRKCGTTLHADLTTDLQRKIVLITPAALSHSFHTVSFPTLHTSTPALAKGLRLREYDRAKKKGQLVETTSV